MTARLKLLLKRVQSEIIAGKSFAEAVTGYLLTDTEREQLAVACGGGVAE